MEIVEIFTDLYFALGSVVSSVSDRLRNYKKILSYSTPGNRATYGFLMSFNELNDTIAHERNAKTLLIDRIENIKGTANIHCILLTNSDKYVNSLWLKANSGTMPIDMYNIPVRWDI